jgi:hypothetical protein
MLPVFEQLIQAGLINVEQSECFSLCCRDESVKVFRDQLTGVIYIDPSYQGRSQIYYSAKSVLTTKYPRKDMDWADTQRRENI